MQPIRVITSTAVPLPIDHVDTDQIIPARFLKATTREGFGENLFRDWRFFPDGRPKTDFVLNQERYAGEILLAGRNFGCGSSREHAAWAIKDYGFKVVVSPGFADIFRNNALNNGLLPVEVSESFFEEAVQRVLEDPFLSIRVDLPAQVIKMGDGGREESFAINAYKKHCLIEGLDDIDYLLSLRDEIEAYETAHHT